MTDGKLMPLLGVYEYSVRCGFALPFYALSQSILSPLALISKDETERMANAKMLSPCTNNYSSDVVEGFGPVNICDAHSEPHGPAEVPQAHWHMCEHDTSVPH